MMTALSSRKHCFKCGLEKDRADFYRHPMMGDGLLGKCKTCTKQDVSKNYRTKNEQYREYETSRRKRPAGYSKAATRKHRLRYPEKTRARGAVRRAVRNGTLIKHPCSVCGDDNSQAHHADYSKPLEVQWLCLRHHRAIEGRLVA